MASKQAVDTVEAVDEALASGTVEQDRNEKLAQIDRNLSIGTGRAPRPGTPVDPRPMPKDLMNDSPLVQDARLAVERASEYLAELDQERINIANAQLDAGQMASNPAQFRELRSRWSEIDGEIYLAKVQKIHADDALVDAQIAALLEGMPELEQQLNELNAQIVALQALAAPLANDGYRRNELIRHLRLRKNEMPNKLGNLENEWSVQLRAQLPPHLRGAVRGAS